MGGVVSIVSEPPLGLQSMFGGPSWTRTKTRDAYEACPLTIKVTAR